jgi:putative pre-16S rRNA nuclease
MRYLAIDLGDKRTGIAVGDDETGIVAPESVLAVPIGAALHSAIGQQIERHEPGVLVLGLPMHMDGTEGERAKLVRAFGKELQELSGLPVEYQDERLTSAEADWEMAGSGMTHKQKKRLRDALAAAIFLRDYLDSAAE